jgi:excisionase family DNA binding protein
MVEKLLLTVREVSLQLSCSEKTVRRLVAEGRLEALKIRNCLRIDPGSVEKYIKRQIQNFQLKGRLNGNF